MVLVPLRFVVVPDGGLLPVGIPRVLPVLQKAVQHRLMLPLVIRAPKHEGILHPDAHPGKVEPRVHKCFPEIQPLRVRMEHISRTAFFQVCRHL